MRNLVWQGHYIPHVASKLGRHGRKSGRCTVRVLRRDTMRVSTAGLAVTAVDLNYDSVLGARCAVDSLETSRADQGLEFLALVVVL